MRRFCSLVVLLLLACSRAPDGKRRAGPAGSASSAPAQRAEPLPSGWPLQRPDGGAVEAPEGFVVASDVRTAPLGAGHAVLLVDAKTNRGVPIFVGGSEGLSIELRLSKQRYERPLTHDLFDSTMRELGARVESARVEKLEGGIYFGVLVVRTRERTFELDARASDAVALALGNGAPIFVAEKVIKRAGIPLDALLDGGAPEESRRPDIRL